MGLRGQFFWRAPKAIRVQQIFLLAFDMEEKLTLTEEGLYRCGALIGMHPA